MRKILIFLSSLLVGCCHSKVTTPSVTATDSTMVKVVHRVGQVTDTVFVEIPKIVESVTKRDTMSLLENDYAISEVVIESEELFHSLATKPQKKAVAVETKIEYRDSIVEKIIEKEIVNTIEVEKPDSWWEQTQKKGFWAMLTVFILLILWRKVKNKITIF